MIQSLKNQVAVVIPLYRLPLIIEEELSLNTARKILSKHLRYFIIPQDLIIPNEFLKGEKIIRLPKKYFSYPLGYNQMLMSAQFYKPFKNFSHILVYQLDCLVFSDELTQWKYKNYDYVGAPWFDSFGETDDGTGTWKVGNGGFSLRKVSTALEILYTRVRRGSCYPVRPAYFPKQTFTYWFLSNIYSRFKQHLHLWTVEDELKNYSGNEDRFWAIDVFNIYPKYKKPDVNEALAFAFEVHPRMCFTKSDHRIPFGCHAWWKHDREFWEYILAKTLV